MCCRLSAESAHLVSRYLVSHTTTSLSFDVYLRQVIKSLSNHRPLLLDFWPPNSPDFNPVDCQITATMQECVYPTGMRDMLNWNSGWLSYEALLIWLLTVLRKTLNMSWCEGWLMIEHTVWTCSQWPYVTYSLWLACTSTPYFTVEMRK